MEEALSFVTGTFYHSIYAIGREEQAKISLIETADKVNIKYHGQTILKTCQ